MPSSRRVLQRLALLVFLIAIETVCTNTPAAQGAAQNADPEVLYQRGFALFQQKDYAGACRDFQQAALHGNVASQSMIQMVNGYGYRCAAPSQQEIRNAPNPLPDVRGLYAGALREARAWRGDAVLTYAQVSSQAHPGYYTTAFFFVSRSARQVLALVSSQFGGPIGPLTSRTSSTPLPDNFLGLGEAVERAHRVGMMGAIDDAKLTIWQGRAGSLSGWLLHSPQNAMQTYLIGALDGRAYPVSQYSYPVLENEEKLLARQRAKVSSTSTSRSMQGDPCSPNSMVPMWERLDWFTPCNEAALQRMYQQSDANYDLWKAGKRSSPN